MEYAIDFGTSNTVVARINATGMIETCQLANYSSLMADNPPLIPSLVYVQDAVNDIRPGPLALCLLVHFDCSPIVGETKNYCRDRLRHFVTFANNPASHRLNLSFRNSDRWNPAGFLFNPAFLTKAISHDF
jgi:hypothetical protein